MTLLRRVEILEAASGTQPDSGAVATFAALVDALDRLAGRKAAGSATVQREIEALAATLERGDSDNSADAT